MQQTHVKYLTSYLPPPPSVFTTRHLEGRKEGFVGEGGIEEGRIGGVRREVVVNVR